MLCDTAGRSCCAVVDLCSSTDYTDLPAEISMGVALERNTNIQNNDVLAKRLKFKFSLSAHDCVFVDLIEDISWCVRGWSEFHHSGVTVVTHQIQIGLVCLESVVICRVSKSLPAAVRTS